MAGERRPAIPLIEDRVIVGRDPAAGILLDSPQASWHHARLIVSADAVTVEDLASKNGTRVNGTLVKNPTPLQDSDDLAFGTVRFVFKSGEKPSSTQTVAPE